VRPGFTLNLFIVLYSFVSKIKKRKDKMTLIALVRIQKENKRLPVPGAQRHLCRVWEPGAGSGEASFYCMTWFSFLNVVV